MIQNSLILKLRVLDVQERQRVFLPKRMSLKDRRHIKGFFKQRNRRMTIRRVRKNEEGYKYHSYAYDITRIK